MWKMSERIFFLLLVKEKGSPRSFPDTPVGAKQPKLVSTMDDSTKRGGGIFHHPSGISFHGGREANLGRVDDGVLTSRSALTVF